MMVIDKKNTDRKTLISRFGYCPVVIFFIGLFFFIILSWTGQLVGKKIDKKINVPEFEKRINIIKNNNVAIVDDCLRLSGINDLSGEEDSLLILPELHKSIFEVATSTRIVKHYFTEGETYVSFHFADKIAWDKFNEILYEDGKQIHVCSSGLSCECAVYLY
ncbi:hypothetical protein KAI92_01630 [Candidatus Parcubacteria bacterium]|nr:hypothetical protein [Candidatus Parcubacteria bacterium]